MITLFIWGKLRYDIVALVALMVGVLVGAVPFNQVYSGLNNPAVITVACIMIISQAIARSGIFNLILKKIDFMTQQETLHIFSFSTIIATFSAFMNNVGALALMLPISIQSSLKHQRSPSLILMPIAMASALGGMITLIGTPPNLIISTFREQSVGQPFNIFDFSYVGIFTALAGVMFVGILGWRFLPKIKQTAQRIETIYRAEIKVHPKSKLIGQTLKDLRNEISDSIEIAGLIRKRKKQDLSEGLEIRKGDIFIIKATSNDIHAIAISKNFILQNQVSIHSRSQLRDHFVLIEAVIPTGSAVKGKTPSALNLRSRCKLSILAISRNVRMQIKRLHRQPLQIGDMVLLQCKEQTTPEELMAIGFLPITELNIQIHSRLRTFLPVIIFIFSIFLVAINAMPVQIAFGGAVLIMILFKLISINNLYRHVDWPIIVLLAAMIPLGEALERTGGAQLIANFILGASHHLPFMLIIGLVLLITMTLSDFINNAATSIVMAPIAISLSHSLQISVDPLLMAVAIGASCAFLTPIGHQNNLLVMGPGKYKFFDYIRMGLPLEIIVILIATPLIYWFWFL